MALVLPRAVRPLVDPNQGAVKDRVGQPADPFHGGSNVIGGRREHDYRFLHVPPGGGHADPRWLVAGWSEPPWQAKNQAVVHTWYPPEISPLGRGAARVRAACRHGRTPRRHGTARRADRGIMYRSGREALQRAKPATLGFRFIEKGASDHRRRL